MQYVYVYCKIYLYNCNLFYRNTAMRVSDSSEKRGSKAIVTTLILVGSFILCFLPFLVITGVNQITNGKPYMKYFVVCMRAMF